MIENLSILISERFFLGPTFPCKVRQGMIRFFLIVIDSKVVSKKLLGSADLCVPQALDVNKMPKVIVIGDDKNSVLAVF